MNCERSAIGERTVRRRDQNLSRDDVVSGGVRRVELRTVRYWRADSPPYSLEFCLETLSSLVEIGRVNCGRSAKEGRTVRSRD